VKVQEELDGALLCTHQPRASKIQQMLKQVKELNRTLLSCSWFASPHRP